MKQRYSVVTNAKKYKGLTVYRGRVTFFSNGKYVFSETCPCDRLSRQDAMHDAESLMEWRHAHVTV